ncbi:MAG: hypothetical protein R6V12_07835, partial [Candidatus Hydrogenedentota bacterium]
FCRPFRACGVWDGDPGAAARASARLAPGYSLSPLRGSGRVSQDGGFLGLAGLWGCRNGEFSRQ